MADLLGDHPYLLYPLMAGCAFMATSGVALWALALYGFYLWVEKTRRRLRRLNRRRKHLFYGDML